MSTRPFLVNLIQRYHIAYWGIRRSHYLAVSRFLLPFYKSNIHREMTRGNTGRTL